MVNKNNAFIFFKIFLVIKQWINNLKEKNISEILIVKDYPKTYFHDNLKT